MLRFRPARFGSCANAQLHPNELSANWALAQELEPPVPINPLP